MTRVAIPVFPGSNCEHDVAWAIREAGGDAVLVHHRETELPAGTAAVVVPGGFAHGDYLRPGAIARFSPIMAAVADAARVDGLAVLGICNGFQVLCEAGLLPGALAKNAGLRFLCRDVHLVVEHSDSPFTHRYAPGTVVTMPVNHFEGCYSADPATLTELEMQGRVLFRYCAPDGTVDPDDPATNPNGSLRGIAGVTNADGNGAGKMPPPARAADATLGPADGRPLFADLAGGTSSPPRTPPVGPPFAEAGTRGARAAPHATDVPAQDGPES